MPELPTIAEAGYPGFETQNLVSACSARPAWRPTLSPSSTPTRAGRCGSPDVAEKLAAQGWDVLASSPADFAVGLKSELDKWSAVIKSAKIKGDN